MDLGHVSTSTLLAWLDQHGCIGKVQRTWAWWQNPDGEKGLAPSHGIRYLYRGQGRRYWSCTASISRGMSTRAHTLCELDRDEQLRLFVALTRVNWYAEILKTHPVFEWATSERYAIDRTALAQHYEMATGYIDLTESLEVALFFACCEMRDGRWTPRTRGRGILYKVDWVGANEAIGFGRIKWIDLQPFPRPHAQWAWTMELMLGEDLEDLPVVEAVSFDHSAALGERLLDLFDGGDVLMPMDPLRDWATAVRQSRSLPLSCGLATAEDLLRDGLDVGTSNTREILRQVEDQNGIMFQAEVPSPADPTALATVRVGWEATKQTFLDGLKGQAILVRTPKDDDPSTNEVKHNIAMEPTARS